MLIEKITDSNKDQLWEFINNNKADFFLYIREFTNNFSKTSFWIALDDDQIVGIMSLDEAKTVQMYGSEEVIRAFFKQIDFIPRYINVPFAAKDLISKYIRSEKRRLKMHRLIMEKKNFSLSEGFKFIHLKKEDMKNALAVFQAAEPEDWSSAKADKLPFDSINQWYGIEVDGQLASVCWNQIYHHGGHIAFIATHPKYQNRGYATALIKLALIETFKMTDFAIIHVQEDNKPALHTYRKIGYKDHLIYLVLCDPEMML